MACKISFYVSFPRKKPRLSAETLVSNISDDGDFTDFTLESEEGAKFPCHRAVLAAQSSVLRRMFLSPMEEGDRKPEAPEQGGRREKVC